MTTTNQHYLLPNKNHDVVEDINDLRNTFALIDADVKNTEEKIGDLAETVSDLENRAVHCSNAIENSEIQNISANRYLVVNQNGDDFECIDGGGDAGGSLGQCSIKKSDGNFDTTWGDLLEVSKNGMTTQENSETSQANETHIFADESEIENETQLPKVELTNCQAKSNFETENNESIILKDEIEETTEAIPIATHENFGLVKIGDGFSSNNGTISAQIISKATNANEGTVKIGDGLNVANGIISKQEIAPATYENFGVVKIGEGLAINSSGEMEISNMANAATIYNLGHVKICNNGIIDLEEQTLQYRLFVNENLVLHFEYDFEPTADFSFVLEIISDGTHLIYFNELLNPDIKELPINRGTTKIFITKKIGVPHYDITISKLDAPEPILLTSADDVRSKFLITAPNGGNWNPTRILRDYYDGYSDIRELYFEFFTLVCVDYVKYWSRSSSSAMNKFIFRGSNDGKNWTTLIYKENEICYGKVFTEIKGCFKYYRLTIGYSGDDNKPGGVMLFGTEIDNNECEVINLTPYMSSNSTGYATLTASNINSGSASNLTDNDVATYMRITSSTSEDEAQKGRWIKYELETSSIANLLELNFTSTNVQTNWFKLEGSNDDENWNLILERQYKTNELFNNGYRIVYYHLKNETAYKYYKLTCLATNDSSDNWDITGFKLFSIRLDGKWNFYTNVPKLSSASQDGYEITASSQWDNAHAAFYAFDGTASTRWASNGTGTQWVQVKFPTATVCNRALITNRSDGCLNQSPTAFKIQGSNDAENWNTLLSVTTSWSSLGESQTFDFFSNETAYLYYRIVITANSGSGDAHALGEFSLGTTKHEYRRWLHKYEYLIPQLTSNTSASGYVASASSEYSNNEGAWRAFDRQSNQWTTKNGTNKNVQLKIQLPTAQTCNLIMLGISNANSRIPQTFRIEASNDNLNWTVLYQDLDGANFSVNTDYFFENPYKNTAFQYYRLYILTNKGDGFISLREFQLIQESTIQEY